MLYGRPNPHGGDIYGGDVVLDFSANTNPYGTPQGILDGVMAALTQVDRYPDPYCRALVTKLARAEDVPEAYLLCGNGAAELIYAYAQAVKPQLAAELAPTFSEYALGMEQVGCRMERYELTPKNGFALDDGILAFLREKRPQVLFLCNPNNPTGQVIAPELMERILHATRDLGTRLFVDECFLDLSDGGQSVKRLLRDNPQVLILKAFTKSYGMAGLRLGYCISSDGALLRQMSEAVQPWNVSSLAQAAGVAALEQGAFLEKTRQTVFRERKWLKQELEKLGFFVVESHANYLLFRGEVDLGRNLRSRGIAIRDCSNYHGLEAGWYRIAVRLPEENHRLIQAMHEVRSWQKTL